MIRLSQRCTSSGAGYRTGSRVLVSTLSLWLGACDLSDSTRISLEIVAPMASATFTSADDVDPNADGTQIEVSVTAVHVRSGSVIELYRLEGGASVEATVATASVERGQALFRAFTLQAGDNALQARLQDAGQVSEPVTVRFRDTCGELAFVQPSSDDDDAIRLGPNDDLDGEACGGNFTTRVIASTGLSDGTEVTLLVNGSESRSTATQGGVAKFDDVLLDNRGETPNQLALRELIRLAPSSSSMPTCSSTARAHAARSVAPRALI